MEWDESGNLVPDTTASSAFFGGPAVDGGGSTGFGAIIRTATGDILNVANSIAAFQATRNAAELQRDQAALSRDLSRLQIDTQRTQANAVADVARLNAQAAVRRASAGAGGDDYLAAIYNRLAASSGQERLMLLIAIAGLVLGFMQFRGKR